MTPLRLLTEGDLIAFVLVAAAIIEAIALHEYAHALAADLQGDRLPRASGRLSLNPTRHLDPLGTLLIFLVGFGWGKPVEFRPHALGSKRFGGALVALAGPAMNFVLAVVAAFVLLSLGPTAPTFVLDFLFVFSGINTLLAAFNLLPIPPLDGSRLLTIFLRPDQQRIVYFLDRYGMLILLAVLLFGQSAVIRPVFGFVQRLVFRLAGA